MQKQTSFVARGLRLAALASVATLLSGSAFAGSISAFSGNTQPSKPVSSGGPDSATVNFAVYDRTSGVAGDTFGTGVAGFDGLFAAGSTSPALDTSASYLYLYQTVANGDQNNSIFQNTVGVPSAFVTSFGSFTGTKFSTTVLGTPAGFANPSSASTPATPTILSGQSGLTGFTAGNSVDKGSSSLKADFFGSEVPINGASVLWGYTSNAGPGIGNTAILETTGAGGAVATAVPEPTAAIGAVMLLGLGMRRKHRVGA